MEKTGIDQFIGLYGSYRSKVDCARRTYVDLLILRRTSIYLVSDQVNLVSLKGAHDVKD